MVALETAIQEINTGKIEFEYKSDDCCTTAGEVVIYLEKLQRKENKKGFWSKTGTNGAGATLFKCSECGDEEPLTELNSMNYCHKRGAEMGANKNDT